MAKAGSDMIHNEILTAEPLSVMQYGWDAEDALQALIGHNLPLETIESILRLKLDDVVIRLSGGESKIYRPFGVMEAMVRQETECAIGRN